jgi:Leucine-rich repeat (LRR) protein
MTTAIESYLNSLSKDISTLDISSKNIKYLPDLTRFKNLAELYCSNNQLTLLPTLPPNLKVLYCSNNQLTLLPTLPPNLEELFCYNNPIYEIVNGDDSFIKIKKNIQLLNNFRHLYYCLKFKKQLKEWLWEKVREPNAKKIYNPKYLIENLGDHDDLDAVLDNWK